MSVPMSLLSILNEGPNYGLRLKQEFERRTGNVWPLNAGQVYATLERLSREGLVEAEVGSTSERQRRFALTADGRMRLRAWFRDAASSAPHRDPLVLKLVMAASAPGVDTTRVVQAERRGAVKLLQEYVRAKRETSGDDDLGWAFLINSLIFETEARVRWLDECESLLDSQRGHVQPGVISRALWNAEPEPEVLP